MASEMMDALMQLCQEKHIDEFYLLDRLETSIAKALASSMKLEWGAKVTIDRTSGHIYVYELEPVDDSMILEGPDEGKYAEYTETDITPKDISRIAYTKAKEEINDIIRHTFREQIYEEFKDRIGDIITGTVIQSTSNYTLLKIRDGVEAELPHYDLKRCQIKDKDGNVIGYSERNERPADERYGHNQRIKAVIIEVRNPNSDDQKTRGERSRPSIFVSRTHPDLLRRLFEVEVPEIYDGVVEIRSIAREAGKRSKVAVSSVDNRLDPVGACVGPKGSRVRAVVGELRGERVDVVPWDDDMAKCVANALSPAKVSHVIFDEEKNLATVIVPDDQLSLAIGKAGQNARLAARLTGVKIDIKNESLASDVLATMNTTTETEDLIDDENHRCEYVGENGVPCRNMARPGSRYCGLHEKLVEVGDVEVSDDPDSLI